MNKAAKLERKSSEESLIKKKKKTPCSRNPLKDLNAPSISPASISSEAKKAGGCLSFLLSNSSSKDYLSRSKPHPLTPKSAPSPNSRTFPAKNPSKLHTKPSKPSSTIPNLPRSQQSLNPKRKQRKPSSKDPFLGDGYSSSGKNPIFSFDLAATPEKTLSDFATEIIQEDINLSKTPNSTTTPPIQASISPEIACGSAADLIPTCFAAGHVIAGVQDRRKCRPRGILTVVGGGGFMNDCDSYSLAEPPIDASFHWLSSPSENVNSCPSVSPKCLDEEKSDLRSSLILPKVSPLESRDLSDDGFWRFSPISSNTSRSPNFVGLSSFKSPELELTPSSGNGVRRTPTTGSSTSPFSVIMQRATASSSKFKDIRVREEIGGYRYGSVMDSSAFLGECWSDNNAISTPSSCENLKNKGMFSRFDLDSTTEVLGTMRLSPQKVSAGLSFQFGCPATPSNSIDLASFQKTDEDKSLPDVRVSWREGLVSRIFEMGDLDFCQWLSDDEEDNANCLREDKIKSEFDFEINSRCRSSIMKEGNESNDKHIADAFESFEFPRGDFCGGKCEAKLSPPGPMSCAESISTDGGGLISSGDSDWTLFYKNHLFEV